MKFHTLKVAQSEKLTPLSKKLTFEVPESLQNDYQFQSGQYVTLDLDVNGNKVKRSYSICSSPAIKNQFSIGIKQIENGLVSTFINQNTNQNDTISVSTPDGSFKIETISNDRQYVFVAGGSGITPILSMLYDILPKVNSKIVLKYSTLNQGETMFFQELNQLKEKYAHLQIDFLFTNGENVLNENNIAEWLKSLGLTNYDVWVCGPSGIIEGTEKACQIAGLPSERFHREYFTAKSESEMQSASVGNDTEAPLAPGESAEVEIKYEGKKLNFTCKYNETILDAALNAGGDPPYSCLVAACSTCRAMCKSGNIQMKDRDALSDKDIDKGFVLTCQALPRSKKIILDYDI